MYDDKLITSQSLIFDIGVSRSFLRFRHTTYFGHFIFTIILLESTSMFVRDILHDVSGDTLRGSQSLVSAPMFHNIHHGLTIHLHMSVRVKV